MQSTQAVQFDSRPHRSGAPKHPSAPRLPTDRGASHGMFSAIASR